MSRKSFMSVMNVNVKIVELDVCTASSETEDRAALRVVLRRAQDEAEDDAVWISPTAVEVARGCIRDLTREVWRPCLLTSLRVVRKTPKRTDRPIRLIDSLVFKVGRQTRSVSAVRAIDPKSTRPLHGISSRARHWTPSHLIGGGRGWTIMAKVCRNSVGAI